MKIAVSIGDINGIGLECFARSLIAMNKDEYDVEFTLFAPDDLVEDYLNSIRIAFDNEIGGIVINNFRIEIKNLPYDGDVEFGKVTELAGNIAVESIYAAAKYLHDGKANCLLTLPINKKSVANSGFNFPGHTEMLGQYYDSDPLMILFSGNVRVALVTVHEPLKNVANLLDQSLIERKYHSLEKSLIHDFGIEKPSIAILGLNPHAGEQGNIGMEEMEYLNETVYNLNITNTKSIAVGPLPADGFFGFGDYKNYDGILAMYHDQGLIPLKLLANGGGVNFTANLPVVRISPDHGTAFEIAGKGIADPASTLEAIVWGFRITNNRSSLYKNAKTAND